MSKIIYIFIALIIILPGSLSQAVDIIVNKGRYFDYYHFEYDLAPGKYFVNDEYGFNPGGQFEVLVPKEYFPIKAPNCRSNVIIRMPWSDKEEKKKQLYAKLVDEQMVTVVLELNPYFNIVSADPPELELEYCNVFFRHKYGDYFDRL